MLWQGGTPVSSCALQALQYLRKLCSHPLLVLDASVPQHAAAVAKAGLPPGAPDWAGKGSPLRALQHAPKLQALAELLQVRKRAGPGRREPLHARMQRSCIHPECHSPLLSSVQVTGSDRKPVSAALTPRQASSMRGMRRVCSTHEASAGGASARELISSRLYKDGLAQECGIMSDAGMPEVKAEEAEAPGDCGHRVLIFAQLKSYLDIVESDVLTPAGISYLRLDGR